MTFMQRLRKFRYAHAGVAAVEFAVLAPMMVFLLLGSVDLIDLLGVNRRAQNVSASISDVVSRDTEISNDEVDGLWAAANVLMQPENGMDMNLRVTSITIQNPTTARVVWSEGRGMSALTANSTIALPDDMMIPGTSVILTETEFPYATPLGILTYAPVELKHRAYRRSRLVDPIPRVVS